LCSPIPFPATNRNAWGRRTGHWLCKESHHEDEPR
jgi:hypothetical protein